MRFAVTATATERGIAARKAALATRRRFEALEIAPPERTLIEPTDDELWIEAAQAYRLQVAAMTVPACHPARSNSKRIIAQVADRHGLTVAELMGTTRVRLIAHARQEAMWRISRELGRSLPEIGRMMGGRDHTTVLHGIRAYEKRLAEAGKTDADG